MPDSVARELKAITQMLMSVIERFPAPVGKDAPEEVSKAGARMARTRRQQLKNAIELLQKLLEEVAPRTEGPSGSKDEPVTKAVSPAPFEERAHETEVLRALGSLSEVMRELKTRVQGQDEALARLKKATGLPASNEVESVRPPKPADDSVSWPLDMNRPLTRDRVAKEVSFLD